MKNINLLFEQSFLTDIVLGSKYSLKQAKCPSLII